MSKKFNKDLEGLDDYYTQSDFDCFGIDSEYGFNSFGIDSKTFKYNSEFYKEYLESIRKAKLKRKRGR